MSRNWIFASLGTVALTVGFNGFVQAQEESLAPVIQPAPAPMDVAAPTADSKKPAIRIEPMQRHSPSVRMVVDGRPGMTYSDAYNQIPFMRAEYEANPGYRHDAAIELLFSQLRPTTLVRQSMPRAFRYPKPSVQYLPPSYTTPFGWGASGFGGYGPNVGRPFYDPSVAW